MKFGWTLHPNLRVVLAGEDLALTQRALLGVWVGPGELAVGPVSCWPSFTPALKDTILEDLFVSVMVL